MDHSVKWFLSSCNVKNSTDVHFYSNTWVFHRNDYRDDMIQFWMIYYIKLKSYNTWQYQPQNLYHLNIDHMSFKVQSCTTLNPIARCKKYYISNHKIII